MANDYLNITKTALKIHGKLAIYKRISAGVYNIETGVNTNTSADYSVLMYKKHIKATQYNYPDLIGKDSAIFYVAVDSLSFNPSPKDKILFDSNEYQVSSYMEHMALGQVILYKILGVKG